jgi:hypothetical protein
VPLDLLLGRRKAGESELAQRLRAAKETASVVEYQLAAILEGLDERFGDLLADYGLDDFEGSKDFDTDARRAMKALNEARDVLIRLSQFELPTGESGSQ